jgi:hypothetical protein
MTDDELRALVRQAVARHLGQAEPAASVTPMVVLRQHPSHFRYALATGDEADGPCLIEPTVRCNHCGYCQSHGH